MKLLIKLKTLIAFHIRKDFQFLYSITGPQGTGKSHLANNIFKLNDSNMLPSEAGRCEQTPVILTFLSENDDETKPVTKIKLIKKSEILNEEKKIVSSMLYRENEELTYEEAQYNILKDDAIMYIWRVPYSPELHYWKLDNNRRFPISPNLSLLVLPGIEDGYRWSEFAKQSLTISDAVINVIDHPNYANIQGRNLINFIKDNNFNSPIIAVSFANSLPDKEEFRKKIVSDTGINAICFIDLPENGFESLSYIVTEKIIKNSDYKNSYYNLKGIKKILRETSSLLKKTEKLFATSTDNWIFDQVVDEMINSFKEKRKHQEKILFRKIEETVNSHCDNVIKDTDKISDIVKKFGGDRMNEKENILQQFQTYQQQLQAVMIQKETLKVQQMEIENALEELKEAKGDAYKIVGSIMVKKPVEQIRNELEAKKNNLEVRIKMLEKTENKLTEKLKEKLTDEAVREMISSEIKRLCAHLPDYKRIKKFQIRSEELPRTTTRKLKRHLIKWIEE